MERTYTIPLRKAFLKAPKYIRTNRAVREVRMFLQRHMKTENVLLGEELNKALWARGDSKPPHHVTVLVKKEDEKAYAELVGKEFNKKDFSAEAADEKKAPAKEAKKDAKAEKVEAAPSNVDPAELIGKAATAKAKAEGKVKAEKAAKK